jgi:hypothetical protein
VKDVEKHGQSYIAGRNVKWHSHSGKCHGILYFFSILKIHLSYGPANAIKHLSQRSED